MDFIKEAKKLIQSDLYMTIMCGPLNTLEQRLKDSIIRNVELMEKAVRYELESDKTLVPKRGVNDE